MCKRGGADEIGGDYLKSPVAINSGFLFVVSLQERKWLLCAGGGSLWRSPRNHKYKGWHEPSQMPPLLVGIGRGLSGLSQRPGEGSVGVFSKCCHLQENNVSIRGLSQDGKQGK